MKIIIFQYCPRCNMIRDIFYQISFNNKSWRFGHMIVGSPIILPLDRRIQKGSYNFDFWFWENVIWNLPIEKLKGSRDTWPRLPWGEIGMHIGGSWSTFLTFKSIIIYMNMRIQSQTLGINLILYRNIVGWPFNSLVSTGCQLPSLHIFLHGFQLLPH